MAKQFLVEGFRTGIDSAMRVSVRLPGVGWSRPASVEMTEHETLALIAQLNAALQQAQEADAE